MTGRTGQKILCCIASFVLLWLTLPVMAAEAKKSKEPKPYAWKAGMAVAKITPEQSMWMAGYAARKKPSEGTWQDLYAKSLAVEDAQGGRLVIITLDLIGVLPSLRSAVENRVQEQYKLPAERLLINASHTHSGPEYRERQGREQEARNYHKFLEETLVRLTGEAIERLAPAELTYCHSRAGFAMNRRLKTEKGYRNSPNPDGPVDHDVPVLIVKDPDAKLRAVLFGYACHNTTLGFYNFCGDYAGYAQEYLQADHPEATAMFMLGCGADQNPYPRSDLKLAQQHGRTLATAVEAALFATPRPVRGPLRCALEKITLQRLGEKPGPQEYPIQVIQFNSDINLVALASEVVVDYSLRLKRELSGAPAVWIAGYSNGYFGYIPSLRVLQEGGYEANPWAPATEEQIAAKVHELDRRLSGKTKAAAAASAPPALDWHDVTTWGVEGRAWTDLKRQRWFDRLPAAAEGQVTKAVWGLSRDSAGMMVRFQTDATVIWVHYVLRSERLAMPHMPATGVSGIDVYARDPQGKWRWVSCTKPKSQEVRQAIATDLAPGLREYTAYLPLYNGVESLEIGVPKDAKFTGLAPRAKPIVFYGTSITHGACASRPGMVHTAILGRRFDCPVVNLGFSGNGRMDAAVGEYLCKIDAAAYVIDCLPNMKPADVRENCPVLVKMLRAARPETAIILVEDRRLTSSWIRPQRQQFHTENHAALDEVYQVLKREGIEKLYYLPGDALLGDDAEGSTDGSHPSDLGFVRQADAFEPLLRQALGSGPP